MVHFDISNNAPQLSFILASNAYTKTAKVHAHKEQSSTNAFPFEDLPTNVLLQPLRCVLVLVRRHASPPIYIWSLYHIQPRVDLRETPLTVEMLIISRTHLPSHRARRDSVVDSMGLGCMSNRPLIYSCHQHRSDAGAAQQIQTLGFFMGVTSPECGLMMPMTDSALIVGL